MDAAQLEKTVAYLKELRDAATAACDAAANDFQRMVEYTVNWGDLFCVEAALFIDDDGFSGYRVTIQEADPYNQDFQEWIQTYLKERGYDAIVVTEW